MCGPAAVFAVSALLTIGSGIVSYQGSKAAQHYNEQVADNNTRIAEMNASDAERLGNIEANERRLKTRLQIGQQVTGFAAQNVEASGTALSILGDTEMFGQLDEQRIRANAARRAWGFRTQGEAFQTQSKLDSFTASVDRAGTILSTGSKLVGGYDNFKKSGG